MQSLWLRIAFSGRILIQATPTQHPYTYRFQQQRLAWGYVLPDAVTDTTAKRRRKAQQLLGNGEGIICRLLACHGRQLYHLVLALPENCHLYWDAPQLAREALEQLLGTAPHYAKVCLSRSGKPHVHVLAALNATELPAVEKAVNLYCTVIQNDQHLYNLAQYFGRPSLEAACRPKPEHWIRFDAYELELQLLGAAEFYLTCRAEAHQRGLPCLPRLAWSKHLPRLKPDNPDWLALLQAHFQQPRKIVRCFPPTPEQQPLALPPNTRFTREGSSLLVIAYARGQPSCL